MEDFGACVADFDGELATILHLSLNTRRESFHAHNEDIGRHRVSQYDAPSRVKKLCSAPINKD